MTGTRDNCPDRKPEPEMGLWGRWRLRWPNIPVPHTHRLEFIVLCALVAGYCALQFHNLLLPGIWEEEATDAIATQHIIQGQGWPLNNNYHSAFQSYLLLPFFLAIKRPDVALRASGICFSLLTIAMTYLCARQFFNRTVALCTLLLLLPNPYFIYMSRITIPSAGIMAAFYLGALLCLRAWSRTERDGHLYCAAFLMGVGICLRLWFGWFIAGLLLAGTLYAREVIRLFRRPPILKRLIGAAVFLMLGLAPFIIMEIRVWGTDAEILHYSASHFPNTAGLMSPLGADNSALARNLAENLHQFIAALAGHMLDCFPDYLNYPDSWDHRAVLDHMGAAYGALLLLSMLCIFAHAKDEFLRKAKFLIFLLAGMLLCSMYTPSVYRQCHLAILFPLPQIIMGLAAYLLFQRIAAGQSLRKTALALLGLLLFMISPIFHLRELSRMEGFLHWSGGTNYYSDASFALADWLQARGILAPKAIDWGVAPVLVLLSNSRIQPQNCSDFTRPGLPMARQEFLSQCADEDSRYVFVEGPECSRDRVSALLKATGKRLVEEKVFFTRNGERAYSIYSVKQRPEGSIGANSKRLKAKTD